MMRTRTSGALCTLTLLCIGTQVEAVQLEAPFTMATRYDASGRLTGSIAPDPDAGGPLRLLATRYTYSQGLLIRVETGQLTSWANETISPAGWGGYGFTGSNIFTVREYTYDNYGRKSTESLRGSGGAIESLVQYSYDSQNRVRCRTVRMNPASFGSLPTSACALGASGPYGPDRITRFTYDNLDQVLTEERAVGTALEQTYVANVYDGHLLISQTDANGNYTYYTYDDRSRPKRMYFPSKTVAGSYNTADYEEYGYDANGNRTTLRKRDGGIINYFYDALNRMILKDVPGSGDDIYYGYDLRGLQLYARYASASGQGVTNAFDGFGLLASSTNNMSGSATAGNFSLTF